MCKVLQKFVQIIFKICSQWPALVQVYLVAPLIPGLDWEVANTSDTYQSVMYTVLSSLAACGHLAAAAAGVFVCHA